MLGPENIQLEMCKVKPGEKTFRYLHLDLIGLITSAKLLSVSKTILVNQVQ